MAAPRPHPPTPRRRALARQAGLSGHSPLLTTAAVWALAAALLGGLAATARQLLGGWVAAGCQLAAQRGTPATDALLTASIGQRAAGSVTGATAADLAGVPRPTALIDAITHLAGTPLLALAAAALIAPLAQTRAGWLPRRRIPGAPALPAGLAARARRGALDLLAAAAVLATGGAWLWFVTPRLANLLALPATALLGLAAAALLAVLATLTIAMVALAAGDAALRHLGLQAALRMTDAELREDARAAGADPRWKARRDAAARPPLRDALATAALVVLGDDLAVAIAWHPARQPAPRRIAAGAGAQATAILALARRYRVPVHRAPALARPLADGAEDVDRARWPEVADLVAASRAG
jgi:type III secretion system FlhB-like substrate exporter